jgi:hypothetical protein
MFNKLSKQDQIDYKKCINLYKENSKKNEFELYIDLEDSIINFLSFNNFIEEENKNTKKYKLTQKGLLAELFNEINPVFFIDNMDWILSIKENILPILSIFIDDGINDDNNDKIVDYNNPNLKYVDDLIKKKYINYFNVFPKWVYHPLNFDFIKTWLQNPNLTLDNQTEDFNIDMGLVVKILIKMNQICEELISNLIKINRTDLTEYLSKQKDLLIRLPLKIDSLYINN